MQKKIYMSKKQLVIIYQFPQQL
uniref:Uncharacterized protein n=1 Tax=Anguilla anguilla TaxID=7936 RepID=A0A0E9WDZ8_ANGAN